jgi:hypothetical protein
MQSAISLHKDLESYGAGMTTVERTWERTAARREVEAAKWWLNLRYACATIILGGCALAFGTREPWLKPNTVDYSDGIVRQYSLDGARFGIKTPWASGVGPVQVNAFHLGAFHFYGTGWMHAAGTLYLVAGLLLVIGSVWQLARINMPRGFVLLAIVALLVLGVGNAFSSGVGFPASIYVSHDLHVYSIGIGYTLCEIGGPVALAGCVWLCFLRWTQSGLEPASEAWEEARKIREYSERREQPPDQNA